MAWVSVSSRSPRPGTGFFSSLARTAGDPVLHLLGGGPGDPAVVAFGAVGGEVVQGELETLRLAERGLQGVLRRVDDGVEDGPSDVLRVQVRVDAAEFGAVGDPEVVQLVVAEHLAQQVHVPGRVGRADVRELVPGILLAVRDVGLLVLDEGLLLLGVVRGAVLLVARVERLVVRTLDAFAPADPPGSKLTRSYRVRRVS